MRTIIKTVYTIDEHPNKDNVYRWIRDNWHDLNDISVSEFKDSLIELQKQIGGKLGFSISAVPDRGETITLIGYDKKALNLLDESDCPLTGVTWDIDIIKALKNGNIKQSLNSLHNDTEWIYSDEGLYELCEANEYEFYEDGSIV